MLKSIQLGICLILLTLAAIGCGGTEPKTAGTDGGKNLYDSNCSGCHGAAGGGTVSGPAINTGQWKDEQKTANLTKKGQGNMPGYQGKLKEEEIQSISKYVASFQK